MMKDSNTFELSTKSARATMAWGQRLSAGLKAGDIVCLFGELGTGKTTFVKGLVRGLHIPDSKVNSPTFVLLNIYPGKLPVYHFDFYRLEHFSEISLIGYEEFLFGNGVSVIEWAERMRDLLPKERLGIYLSHRGGNQRLLRFKASGERYQELLQFLCSRTPNPAPRPQS